MQYVALILLSAHAVEVLIAFKSVKRYKGALVVSVALTLLFGLLHWIPLAREARSLHRAYGAGIKHRPAFSFLQNGSGIGMINHQSVLVILFFA